MDSLRVPARAAAHSGRVLSAEVGRSGGAGMVRAALGVFWRPVTPLAWVRRRCVFTGGHAGTCLVCGSGGNVRPSQVEPPFSAPSPISHLAQIRSIYPFPSRLLDLALQTVSLGPCCHWALVLHHSLVLHHARSLPRLVPQNDLHRCSALPLPPLLADPRRAAPWSRSVPAHMDSLDAS